MPEATSSTWLDDLRAQALESYEAEPVPTWRRSGFWTTSLRDLDLDSLETRRYESSEVRPPALADALGDDEVGALVVQRGATTIHVEVTPELTEQGVIVSSLETAVEEHPDLVREWYMRRLSHEEGKFAAAAAAFWTGGVFICVPKDVKVERPIQTAYVIDEAGVAQYAHTLAIVGENSECSIREYCLGTAIDGQALHAGAFELYARPGSNVRLAHFHDWGPDEIYDISTKRVEIARDAHVDWVPVHLGGRLVKQVLDIVTAEQGSDMRHTGLYFTERDEHLDLFTTDKHEQGHTTGDTVWKGALTGNSRASYEGLIHIVPNAQESHTYLQTHQMLLSQKAKGDAIPSLIVETDSVSASHGGTVGELDEEQIFYMMSRGITRADAVRVLVEGYFEEVVQRLYDEGMKGLVRRRIARKLEAAEDQVAEFIDSRVKVDETAPPAEVAPRVTVAAPQLDVRGDFPLLGSGIAYLDSAATSQKPASVLGAMDHYYRHSNAPIHRSVYPLAAESTALFESARERVAAFVGWDPATTIFTRNATEAINLVAYSWGRQNVDEGDEVLITRMEHHSNIVPWQLLCAERGARLRYLNVSADGELDLTELDEALAGGRVKLVGVAHISNVLGTLNPVAEICAKARAAGAATLVDGSQAVPQMPVDLSTIGADFYVWTGHKALGPTGIGVLHGQRDVLEAMPPFLSGGHMISRVDDEMSTWGELPSKFEAGTSEIAEAVGLGAAVDYLSDLGMENVRAHERELTAYALERLAEVEGITVFGPPDPDRRGGVMSFTLEGMHPHDIGELCGREGVCIRAGHHCAQPLMRDLGVGATARASLHVYNSREDIDRLVTALTGAREVFGL